MLVIDRYSLRMSSGRLHSAAAFVSYIAKQYILFTRRYDIIFGCSRIN